MEALLDFVLDLMDTLVLVGAIVVIGFFILHPFFRRK